MLVSESQEMEIGTQAYRQVSRDNVLSRDPEALRLVRKVGERIARAANKPEYQWEFRVIEDPDTANAFALPGGKVAVYSGIFPIARDEAGLAVILGHEVAHDLARHAGERMSQSMLLQLGSVGVAAGLGGNPQLANQVMQAYGLGAQYGLLLPFSRGQESEADHIGLLLMAKAGYDPREALPLWERMERKDRGAPPEFVSTHPSYETRTQQIRQWLPEALALYHPTDQVVELLPSQHTLDSPAARMERELIKRIQGVNKQAAATGGERAVVQALGYNLRMDPAAVYQERQQLQLGYGQYAALRGLASLGRASIRRIVSDYQSGMSWSELAQNQGTQLSDLTSWMVDLLRTASVLQSRARPLPLRPAYPIR